MLCTQCGNEITGRQMKLGFCNKCYFAEFRGKNREKIREYAVKYYANNADKIRRMTNARNSKNVLKRREYGKLNNQKRRMFVLSMVSGGSVCCSKCGFGDWRALQIDHINGNGNTHRKSIPHGSSVKFWEKELKEKPNEYQLLCANCNWIKRYENNELSWDKREGNFSKTFKIKV